MKSLFKPLYFQCGQTMKNRFMLAALTNTQSHDDGTLSDDEFRWLTMRAEGGFGITMTCASHVQANGQGFPGQLGIFSDKQVPGHQRLASEIQKYGSLAVIQLHHAGIRSPREIIGQDPVGPSSHEKTGSRALSIAEVHELRDSFIEAAIRAEKCGYNGVEVHGAHGYILCQFLSSEYNHREDEYGGSFANRSRLILEIIDGIRSECGDSFLIGLRLSPERFGMRLGEIKAFCQQLAGENKVDFLDLSLWDCFKEPEEEEFRGTTLLEQFTAIDYHETRLTVAGKIYTAADTARIREAGVDFVTIGRAAILHHNFPEKVRENPGFKPVQIPVSRDYLRNEGLGEKFLEYMERWPDFIAD